MLLDVLGKSSGLILNSQNAFMNISTLEDEASTLCRNVEHGLPMT
jgi:hypothetical protein